MFESGRVKTVHTGVKRVVRRVAIALAVGVLAAGGLLAAGGPAAATEESTVHALTNQSRAAAGLAPLTHNAAMSHVALAWAHQMAARGRLSHNPSYSTQIPAGWRAAAENVAQGYAGASALHQGWMASSGHRANILGDFTDIGIAHIAAGGTTWSVQVFAKYPGAATAPVPAPVPVPVPVPVPAPVPAPAAAPPAAPDAAPGAPEAEAEADPAPVEDGAAASAASPEAREGDESTGEGSDDAARVEGRDESPRTEARDETSDGPVGPLGIAGAAAGAVLLGALAVRFGRPSKWGRAQR